jgi:hypothetical protein
MTHKQAMQEAHETAMQSGRAQIIYYRKPHWWNRKDYGHVGFNIVVNNDDYACYSLVAMVYPDGKIH